MRALLNKTGYTLPEFAAVTKISTARLQQFIQSKAKPQDREVERIARAAGLTPEEVKDYLGD